MSAMSELYTEMETDFERLSITSMEWSEKTWAEQYDDGRFEGMSTFDHKFIYWFEDYAYLMSARDILKEFGEDYAVLFDIASDQWALTTPYASIVWRAN